MVVNSDDCLCILLCLALVGGLVVGDLARRFSPPPKPKPLIIFHLMAPKAVERCT